MKKILGLILIFSLAFVLAGCRRQEKAKEEILNMVEENYEAIIRACQGKDEDALYRIGGIEKVEFSDGYVVCYCMGGGIAPSSQDYGFYYSEENLPAAVDCNEDIICNTEDLMPKGNGYQYILSGNVFYTELIKGNVYFYSTAY